MSDGVYTKGSQRSAAVTDLTWEEEEQQFMDNLEGRLERLRDRMARWVDAPYFMWISQSGSIPEACEEVAVREAELRWIIKIAKRSQGDVRARLWRDVERSLSELEDIEGRIAERTHDSDVVAVSAYSRREFASRNTDCRNSHSLRSRT